MHRIFLPIYRFFKDHKVLMYLLMFLTFILFVVFGLQMKYEENLLKLFPLEDQESEIAFENLRVKDKMFVQMTSVDESLAPDELAFLMDTFMDELLEKDAESGLIENTLFRLEDDMTVNALGFALEHVPSFVDTACYAAFDRALDPKAIQAQMKANKKMMEADETGDITQMVTSDPLGLLPIIGQGMLGNAGAPSRFAFIENHLFSADSTVALAFITPIFNSLDSGTGTRFVGMLESEIAAFTQAHPETEILFHGNVAASTNHSRRIKKDLAVSLTISLILIVLILLVFFKSGTILWQNIVPIIYGAVFALACMFWLKGGMSLMALAISAVILGVGLSYCMHITIHFNYVQSPSAVLRDESTPVFLGCLTTVGAFLGLLFTESELLKDFGLFATFALIGSTLFALVFLPHFLQPRKRSYNKQAFRLIDSVSEYPFDRKPWILILVAVFVAVGIFFSPRVQFDNDLRNLDYIHPNIARSIHLYQDKNHGGDYEHYFASLAPTADEAILAARRMQPVLDSLMQTHDIHDYSLSFQHLYCTVPEQEARIAAWNAYWTPERVNTTMARIGAAALANGLHPKTFAPFRALLEKDYQPESLYESGVIPDSILSNFLEEGEDGQFMSFTPVYLIKTEQDAANRALTALPHTIVLDPFWYCRDIVEVVHEDFNVALLISSIFVFLILLISFRNLWIALIAFMPMALSWYVVEGMMALLGIQFNLINIVISTFIFGIGVDYSIFVMEGLLNEARNGDKSMLAFHKTAIFFSALVLIIVVCSLIFAQHPAIRSIGTSTLIGMVTTIAITYTLEPWIFRKLLTVKYFRRSFRVPEEQ